MFSDSLPPELLESASAPPKSIWRRRWVRVLALPAFAAIVWCGYQNYAALRIRSLSAECDGARESANWAELERSGADWARWQPSQALPWLHAAEGANQRGDLEAAARYLTQLPDGDPRTPAGLLELSHLQFGSLNRPLDAAETCRRILALDPHFSEAHRRLIFFYAVSRQRGMMIEEARRAIENDCDVPETFVYLIGADWIIFTNGFELNNQWLQTYRDHEVFLVARALNLIGARAVGKVDDEPESKTAHYDAMMDRLMERFPKNIDVLEFHLRRSCTRGDQRRVAELLSQAPPAAIEDSRFWRFKGWLHAAREELTAAAAAYHKALELYPFDWQAQHELSAVLRRSQKFEAVREYQDRAMMGKEVMKNVLQSPDTQSIHPSVMGKMADYAQRCGDELTARRLYDRLRQIHGTNRLSAPAGPTK